MTSFQTKESIEFQSTFTMSHRFKIVFDYVLNEAAQIFTQIRHSLIIIESKSSARVYSFRDITKTTKKRQQTKQERQSSSVAVGLGLEQDFRPNPTHRNSMGLKSNRGDPDPLSWILNENVANLETN